MTTMPLPIVWLAPDAPPRFPPAAQALRQPNGLLAAGGDLSPERLLAAYAHGIFPWYSDGEPILWWSPDPRCVFRTETIRASRRLRRQLRQSTWTLSVDCAFDAAVAACAEPRLHQPGTWITAPMAAAYARLHRLGHAHSVEVWDGAQLVGGIYGVAIGRAFSGESMFSRQSGGSKAALLALAWVLRALGCPLLDAQVPNPHLHRLGAITVPRDAYLHELAALTASADPAGSWRGRFTLPTVAKLASTPAP